MWKVLNDAGPGILLVGLLFIACNLFNIVILISRAITRRRVSLIYVVNGLLVSAAFFADKSTLKYFIFPILMDLSTWHLAYVFYSQYRSGERGKH